MPDKVKREQKDVQNAKQDLRDAKQGGTPQQVSRERDDLRDAKQDLRDAKQDKRN